MRLVVGEQCNTAIQFVVWWAANSLYAVDVQKILRRFDDAPLMFIDLALLQIVVGIGISLGIKHSFTSRNNVIERDSAKRSRYVRRTNLAIGCLHIFAVMITNYSYRTIGSTSTLVWKLSEPFAAIMLKYLILKEGTEPRSLAGVILIVMGVLMYSVNSVSLFAASPVVLSNILFPTRNAVVKLSQKYDDRKAPPAQRYSAFLYFSLPFAVCVWALKILFEPTKFEAFPLLLRNALVFNLYQLASISLLEKLDSLTHSLANTVKRFLGILLSAFLLKESFTKRHLTGLSLTVIGFSLYIQKGMHKPSTSSRLAHNLSLFGTLVLILYGMISHSLFGGSEFAFNGMENPVGTFLESESLTSAPEHGTHRGYLDSLIGVRSDLYIMPRGPLKMSEYTVDEDDIWSYSGDNLGNLVWARAAIEVLPDFSSATTCDNSSVVRCFNSFKKGEGFSSGLYFWPVANIFHEKQLYDVDFVTSRLKTGYEILIIGAGFQSSFDRNAQQLKSSHRQEVLKDFHSKQALKLLGELETSSQTIMVRGDMTLQSIEHAGFTHGISAGCPSLFLNREVRLGRLLEGKYEALGNRIGDTSLKIALNIAEGKGFFKVLLKIFNKYPQSVFFAQEGGDLNALKKANVTASRVRLFSNVDKWKAELHQMDVVFGGRIHGNMLGLGSSVPVFVIAPDYRVLELVERMMIPHTTVFDERFRHDLDVAELVYNERMNATKFDTNRCEIAKLYRSVFERYGFGVSKHVWQISQIC